MAPRQGSGNPPRPPSNSASADTKNAAQTKENPNLDLPVRTKIVWRASFPLPSDDAAALVREVPSGKMLKVAIDRIFEARPARE